MRGCAYGEETPTEACPYCGVTCHADWVDVGIGFTQCGPFHCTACGASEIGPYDEPRELTAREVETHWYAPASEPGSSANAIAGRIVGYKAMDSLYRSNFFGGGGYHGVPGFVEEWLKRIRQPIERPSPNG